MSKTKGKSILFIAMFSAFLTGINLAIIGSLETWIVKDLSISHSLAGFMQSAFYIGNLIGSLSLSWMFYKFKRKTLGVVAFSLVGFGCLLSGSRFYELFVFGRFLAGFGNSWTIIFFSAVIVHSFEGMKASLLNIFHAAVVVGIALTLVGSRSIAMFFGSWSVLFWVIGGIAFLLAILLIPHVLPDMRKRERISFADIGRMVRTPILASVFLILTCYVIAQV